ncbi:efflux transporter outer membrane subunit [Cupriavidus basilensis]
MSLGTSMARARHVVWMVPIALMATLAGCAAKPELAPTSLNPVESLATKKSLVAADRPTATWPDDRWWEAYGDKQLDQLVDQALSGAPSLASAAARLRNAQAVAEQSGAGLFPQVSVNLSANKAKQSYNYISPAAVLPHGWRPYGHASLDFSYEFDFWGKNRAALAAATSDAQAASADEAQARLVLATSVVDAYADLARLHAERDCASAAREVRSQTVKLFVDRHAYGLETEGSVQQEISRRDTSEAELLSLDELIALTHNRIAALMGAGPDRGLEISRPAVAIGNRHGLPEGLTLQLLGRRPDIVAARLRTEAASGRIHVAEAAFYPDVSLSALVGVQSLGLNMLMKSGSVFGSVGPAISLPIFSGGRLRGQYRAAQATYDEAVANYNDTLVKALRDVADAAVSSNALQPRLDATRAAFAAASRARDVIQARYAGGLASYLDVLSTEDSLIEIQRRLADMEARAFSLDIALIRALGGGYQSQSS